jgi:Holliday junction resolvase RusA-like endonuclease
VTPLSATLQTLPPSVNKLYKNNPWGGRVLSPAAKKFTVAAKLDLSRVWAFEEALRPNEPYVLSLVFFLPKVVNSGWPKTKTRFKKQDVTNYIKLLEDVICEVCGIDDSCFMEVHVAKREDPENPRIEILIKEV